MNKIAFLLSLHTALAGLSQNEVEERLSFYSEMIEDRMEEGLSEEEAVAAVGSVEEITAQIVADIPLTKIAKEKIRPKRRLKAGEILLLSLGAPLWLPLLIAAFAVVLSLYISLWAVIVSLWASFGALAGSAVGGIAAGVGLLIVGKGIAAIPLISGGLVCAGLTIFLLLGCKAATKGIVLITRKALIGIKLRCLRKEDTNE